MSTVVAVKPYSQEYVKRKIAHLCTSALPCVHRRSIRQKGTDVMFIFSITIKMENGQQLNEASRTRQNKHRRVDEAQNPYKHVALASMGTGYVCRHDRYIASGQCPKEWYGVL